MHDPQSVAFEIYLGKKKKKDGSYRSPLITIWHVDPETDGTDDSCGWMIRERHVNQEMLSKIKKEFDFNFKHNYWFDKEGKQIFSTIGTLVMMYECALWQHYNYNRKKRDAFMRKHLARIIHLAENAHDCMGDCITGKFYLPNNMLSEDRFNGMTGMVYTDILRLERKWYQEPKWHIHHWKIVFHPLRSLKRRWWDKCSKCGKRGFKKGAYSDWNGTELWHEECETSSIVAYEEIAKDWNEVDNNLN